MCSSHTSSPFCSGYSETRVSQTICLGWPQTMILLISASQVARIIGVGLDLFLSKDAHDKKEMPFHTHHPAFPPRLSQKGGASMHPSSCQKPQVRLHARKHALRSGMNNTTVPGHSFSIL
jgi:hypothetical protein